MVRIYVRASVNGVKQRATSGMNDEDVYELYDSLNARTVESLCKGFVKAESGDNILIELLRKKDKSRIKSFTRRVK